MTKAAGKSPAINRQKQTGRSPQIEAGRPSAGELVKIHRKEAGISQETLAQKAGVSERTIRTLEKGFNVSDGNRQSTLTALNQLRLAAGYPAIRLVTHQGAPTLTVAPEGWLELPTTPWLRHVHGPGALLTADYRVVPFHGARSERERDALLAWCHSPDPKAIRVYKGAAGMGKTRLALELCIALNDPGLNAAWTAGFARLEGFPTATSPWEALPDPSRSLLVVVDYAGEARKTQLITQLLRHLNTCPAKKVRLLFLERDDLWLGRLHVDRAAREILLGPLLSKAGEAYAHSVAPVAMTFNERADSFRRAAKAFNEKLALRAPLEPAVNLSGKLYDQVLFLHIQALLAVTGTTVQRRDAILQHLLARERDYWRQRMVAVGMSPDLLPAVERAVFEISSQDGVNDMTGALRRFTNAPLLRDQPEIVQRQIAALLRECYPAGDGGIGALRPDELKHFLMTRFVHAA